MKPQDLYSGVAPAAMAQMGQGFSQAGANIGQIYQQGLSNVGSQIGDAASSAIKEYESSKTSNSITKLLLNDSSMSKQLLGLDDEARQKLLDQFNQTVKDHGQVGGAQFSKQFLGPIQEYATIGRQYKQQMDIKNAEIQAQRQQPFYVMGAQALGQAAADQQDNPQKRYGFGGGRSSFAPQRLDLNPKTYLGF